MSDCDYGLIVPAGVMDGEVVPYGKKFSEWHVWATKKIREPIFFRFPFVFSKARREMPQTQDSSIISRVRMLCHFDQPRNIVQVVKRYILSPNTTRIEIGRDAVSRPPCGPKALGGRHKSRP